MKGIAALILAIVVLSSCNRQAEQQAERASAVEVDEGKTVVPNLDPMWQYDGDSDSFVKVNTIDDNLLTQELVFEILNRKYNGQVELVFDTYRGDTIYVRIADAIHLSENMGSTGSWAYLGEATYSLTELDGVDNVFFDFEEGSHAVPGVYNRDSFVSRDVDY